MAPGRRRGAKGGRTRRELSLGDLVLAKVKGFPAWPAKIGRPEDWDKTADPKKQFVEFFGTGEIAFVAPADIQEFNHEVKKKLCDRGIKGKSKQKFELAVKQICEAFDKRQPNNPKSRGDAVYSQTSASEADSPDQVVNETILATENDGIEVQGQLDPNDVTNHLPVLANGKKLSPSASNVDKSSLSDTSSSSDSLHKDEDSHGVKDEGGSSDDGKDGLSDRHISPTANGQRKKHEGIVRRSRGSAIISAGKVYRRKVSPGGSLKIASSHSSKSGRDIGNEKDKNKLVGREVCRKRSDDARDAPLEHKRVKTRRSVNAKVIKSVNMKGHANQARASDSMDKKLATLESRMSESVSHQPVELDARAYKSKDIDEDDQPSAKRHRRAIETTQSSGVKSDIRSLKSANLNVDVVLQDKLQSPVVQLPKKRRAVRLCDNEDDEQPKTPVHGGLASKTTHHVSDSKNRNARIGEKFARNQIFSRNSETTDFETKEQLNSGAAQGHRLFTASERRIDKTIKETSVPVLQSEKRLSLDSKPVTSAKRSPQSVDVSVKIEDIEFKSSDWALGNPPLKKTHSVDELSHSTTYGSTLSDKKFHSESIGAASSIGHGERTRAAKDVKTSIPIVSKISDSVMSMRHLIAAAQERKKQARLQNSYGNPLFLFPDADIIGRGPSPSLSTQAPGFVPQLDIQGSLPAVLESDAHLSAFTNQNENEEADDNGMNSEIQETGRSLSVDTDAVVARDAFEGMIETISRTKESIGRATRLAIDCAKYGIANEVMERLIRKLESEPSLPRKVDLFFLVDSITQCSHGQKGIAGASYIPIVTEVLPRLVGAAAPAGSGAQENRRQCLKVLRLWLERKILPETVLCACMNDIKQAQDDSPGLLKRRSSRSERAIHDPIREMEGIVVDEYGSNATFQLPGLFSGNVFEEEEYEGTSPANLSKDIGDTPSSKDSPTTSGGPGNHAFTSNDLRHCILEDVDGELEMEDVSGNFMVERLSPTDTSQPFALEPNSVVSFGTASSIPTDSPSSEYPPPLPPGSPPLSPPLPNSPHPNIYFSTPPPPLPILSPPSPPPSPLVTNQNSCMLPGTQAPSPAPDPPQLTVEPLPPRHPIASQHQIAGHQMMSNAPRPPPNDGTKLMSSAPLPPPNGGPQVLSNSPPPPNGGLQMVSNAPPPPPDGGPQMMSNAPPPPPNGGPQQTLNAAPPLRAPLGPSSLPPFGRPPFGPVAPPVPGAGPLPPLAPPMQVYSIPPFPGHPPMHPRHMPQVSSVMSHAPQLAYQRPPMQHEVNQPTHDSSIRNEVLSQQSSCCPPPGISTQGEPTSYTPRAHGDAYMNPQVSHQGQHFPSGGISFAHGRVHPDAQPLRAPPSHFSYLNAAHQSQPPPYSSMNISDGSVRYASSEQQWMQTNQFNADGSRSGWIPGGRPHSGYFGFTPERPPTNLHHSAAPSTGQVPAHGGTTMPQSATSSSHNWRPS